MDKTRTYALRFEVKDGQVVKAEFQDIAKTGDKSMKTLSDRIKETAKSLTTLKGASSALSAIQGPLKSLAGIGVGLAASFAWLTKSSYDWAGELKDGALQANLATDAFQELRYVAVMTGVEFGTLTANANKFFALADEFVRTGGGSAAEAFKAIGLSQKDVNAGLSDGDKLFTEVIDRLRKLDATSQINMSQKLFGKEGGKEFLKLLAESSDEVARLRMEARNLGLVLSEDMIQKADEASDKIGAMAYILQTKVKVAVIENSDAIFDLIDRALEHLPEVIEKATLFAEKLGLIDGRTAAEKLNDLNKEIEELEKQVSSPTFMQKLDDFKNKLYLKAGFEDSVLGGPIEIQQDKNQAELERLRQEKAALEVKIAKGNGTYYGPFLEDKKSGGNGKRTEGYVNSGGSGSSDTDRILERIKAMQQEIEVTKLSAREQAALRAEQSLGAKATEEQRRQARELALVLYDQTEAMDKAKDAARDFENATESVANSLDNVIGDALKGNLRTWEDWSDAVLDVVGEVAQQMVMLSGGSTGSFTKSIAEGLMGAFGLSSPTAPTPAGRASGGPVSAGQFYRVHEREAEYFAPDRNGRMIPVSKMSDGGGGGNVNVTVINSAGAQVSTQARQAGGDRELLIMIDQANAQNMKNPSSATSQAMKSYMSPEIVRR